MAVRASRSGVLGREPAGADGNIATEAVVRSPADGHKLLLVISANTIKRDAPRQTQLRAFCCGALVRFWHKADIQRRLLFVRFWGQSGHR
jgi:hypothetical protein